MEDGGWQGIKDDFPVVFSGELSRIPAEVEPMTIQLVEDFRLPAPAKVKRQSAVIRKFIQENVNSLLMGGFIIPSISPVASRVVVVRAANRDWRFCVDLREINKITVSNAYPLPVVKAILERVKGYKFYAKLDLKKGYHQVALDVHSRYLSAFICEEGLFEFTRIPFGLKNAPAFFQGVLSRILNGLIGVVCELYIDDIIIFANSMVLLTDNVRLVLQRLNDVQLRVNVKKCIFGVSEIEFLGTVVSAMGVRISPVKLDALMKLVSPVDRKTLKSFLGLANWFRDFVPNFSSKVVNMTSLLSPKVHFVWNEDMESEFKEIRSAICNAPILHLVDYQFPLIVRTDASDYGIGAVLLQVVDGSERVIAFMSKKLSSQAKRWSTIDKEGFAIFHAIQTWECYLRGHRFIVQTDHRNLVYVLRSDTGRVARWRLFLQEFDFVVEHLPGKENIVADALSRCCVVSEEAKVEIEKVHNEVVGHLGVFQTLRKLKDNHISWKGMRKSVVEYIKSCSACQKVRVTSKDCRVEEYHVIEAYEPFQEVSIDSIVNLPTDVDGNKVILVIIDNFSKFVELFAVKDLEATTAARCLLQLCCRYGPVSIIRSDNGGQFVSDVFKSLVELMGTKQLLTVGYRPSANGVVERVNAEVIRHLSAIVHSRKLRDKWSMGLPLVQRILNSTVHSSTGFSPAELIFGGAIDVDRGLISSAPEIAVVGYPKYVQQLQKFQVEAIAASQVHMASVHDHRVDNVSDGVGDGGFRVFQRGDFVVALKNNPDKFDYKWRGPFRVVESCEANIYQCMDLRTGQLLKFDVSALRKFECAPGVDPVAVAGWDEDEFVVDSILSHELKGTKVRNRTHYYFRVKFVDGSEDVLPYMEVRDLEAFDTYLRNHRDFARLLRLEVPF